MQRERIVIFSHTLRTVMITAVFLSGCASFLNPTYNYDDINAKRDPDQSYFEDSLNVFFFDYPNPYPDKEVLWFASYSEGPVEMRIHNMENDSLVAVYKFKPQKSPLYPIAYKADESVPVKCVVTVNGRPRCAKQMPWIYPLPVPQWGTEYSVEETK